MLIAQGYKGISNGNVNLWGIEKPVSIFKAQKNLEFKMKLAQELEIKITAQNLPMQRFKIKRLLFTLTKRLDQMRRRLTGEFLVEQCSENMKERNPDQKDAFEYVLGLIFKNTTQIENCISRACDTNLDICHILAEMRQSKCCVPETKFVKLHKQPNYFALLPTEYLSKHINMRSSENHIYCTQYSDLWWELRGTALITGSTMMKALGSDTLKAEKQHVNVFVKKRPQPEFSDEVKKYINFRKENEVHAISTLVGLILPALKPKCYSFYEVGLQFIHGKTRQNLIEVSVDGIIECPIGPTCMNKRDADPHKCIIVEAKCIFPSADFPKFPLYSLPFHHVPQVLAEMKAYSAQQLWLVSYTVQSTTLIEVDFDTNLWDKLMNLVENKYRIAKPVVPTRLHVQSKTLRSEMLKFIKTHSRLVCEVTSFRGELEVNLPEFYISPYSSTSIFLENKQHFLNMFRLSCLIADKAQLLIQKIHDVLRLQATELLVFIISDKDRLQHSSAPNSMPIAYVLKGRCLSNSS